VFSFEKTKTHEKKIILNVENKEHKITTWNIIDLRILGCDTISFMKTVIKRIKI